MKVFQKREKLIQNISYMGIMAGVNVVLSLIASFFPLTSLFIMIVAPMCSAIIGYYCKDKYLWIYLLASIALVLITTCYDLSNTLFYTIPSICSGTLFGFLRGKKRSNAETIFIVSILSCLLTYLSLLLVELIYEIDMIQVTLVLFKLIGNDYIDDIIPSFIFAYSLVQTGLSALFIQLTSLHFDETKASKQRRGFLYSIYGLIFLALTLAFAFWSAQNAYFIFLISLYWSVFAGVLGFRKSWTIYIGYSLSIVIGIILFLLLYSFVPENKGLLLFAIPLFGVCLSVLLNNLLFQRKITLK